MSEITHPGKILWLHFDLYNTKFYTKIYVGDPVPSHTYPFTGSIGFCAIWALYRLLLVLVQVGFKRLFMGVSCVFIDTRGGGGMRNPHRGAQRGNLL